MTEIAKPPAVPPGAGWQRTLPLRWRDLDHLGHVYHGALVELLDEARAAWMGEIFPAFAGDEYVLARQELDYVGELRFDGGPVVVEIRTARIGAKSVRVSEVMRDAGGSVVVDALSTIVMWDVGEHRSRALDPGERAALEAAPRVDGRTTTPSPS
jgi:acyl-CoA thioester hydrolase